MQRLLSKILLSMVSCASGKQTSYEAHMDAAEPTMNSLVYWPSHAAMALAVSWTAT